MYKLIEVCVQWGIRIHGIIDSDYHTHDPAVCDLPIVDTEMAFEDPEKLTHYQENYNFFCAVNWMPMTDPSNIYNRNKRQKYINLIRKNNFNCISLVNYHSDVSKYSHIGVGVFVDTFGLVEAQCSIEDFVSIYAFAGIGHHSTVKENTVIQRHCSITAHVTIERDSYVGIASKVLKNKSTIGANSFIHPGIILHRSTIPNETVSLTGKNIQRVTTERHVE
jgi:UDP-3-O-[3-hydroxymyristoyl] glucosamine N-acyltransferase